MHCCLSRSELQRLADKACRRGYTAPGRFDRLVLRVRRSASLHELTVLGEYITWMRAL